MTPAQIAWITRTACSVIGRRSHLPADDMVCHGGRLDAWQLNVEQVMSTMETSKQQAQLLAALKAGSAAVAELQREVTLADVEALMDSSAEAQATQEAMQARRPLDSMKQMALFKYQSSVSLLLNGS